MGRFRRFLLQQWQVLFHWQSKFGNILFFVSSGNSHWINIDIFFSLWLDSNKLYKGIISCFSLFSYTSADANRINYSYPIGLAFLRKYGRNFISWSKMGIFVHASLILPFIWYLYVYHLTKTSIDVFGVFVGHDKYQTIHMLTTTSWYREMLNRILRLLSGHLGFFITFIGFLYNNISQKRTFVPVLWIFLCHICHNRS